MTELDNTKEISSTDLKEEFLKASAQENKVETEIKDKPEDTPVPEVKKVEEVKEKAPEDDLILGKFKSDEDVRKAYTDLEKDHTKKNQELADLRKTAETTPAQADKVDSESFLWNQIFGQQKPDKVSEVVGDSEETLPIEDERIKQLEAKYNKGEQAIQYMLAKQTAESERVQAYEELKNDPILPFTKEVETKLETEIFSKYPQLKYSKDGYKTAHKLLKGQQTADLVQQRVDEAVKEALEKKEKNENAIVETPGKTDDEPIIRPEDLDVEQLRSHIASTFGVEER